MTVDDAKKIAHELIQGYIGPNHLVMDMPSFYGALVQASKLPINRGGKIGPKPSN